MFKERITRLLLPSLILYRSIAVCCLIILIIVQARLIYNTYELKNRQYNVDEKERIDHAYKQAIRNEILFPGGAKILHQYITQHIDTLQDLYLHQPKAFEALRKQLSDKLYRSLRRSSTMDSLFRAIHTQLHLTNDLLFLLTLNNVAVTFDGISYIPIYHKGDFKDSLVNIREVGPGMLIDGNLLVANRENLVTSISISDPSPFTLQVSFSLYVDQNNRQLAILKQMIPTLSLSLLSIAFVLVIYYFTYKNWLKQKKLADMKSDFLNSITHEFNTPISAILIANKSLQNQEIITNPQSVGTLTDIIKRQTDRLQALINQALDITSMNKQTIEKKSYILEELLGEIVNDYRLKTAGQAYINYTPATSSSLVKLNRFLFTTMLYNIFDNALKYNEADVKHITVKTVLCPINGMVLSIKDNGIGIAENTISHIFEKFYRGKQSSRVSGLGLGLFYVKQSLEAHGWKLNLQSQVGLGTEFRIFIPYHPNTAGV
ncbi:sensor histidine kinase KdpD [Olivibacter sp. XZL3]|uniref:sensor histidine kinase n=1 Tax=Olivibacter sp. XZL3 TaxID=1735116 RepID=UPI00106499F9|nr:HAMP domain-containing sensor histidine kinase [Olivibacter sp. XZL3]